MDIKKFQLKLKVIWFENFLGIGIDQVSSNQQYFLTPYYFWPKTEAWKQLKLELDSKIWLTQDEKLRILKLTGDLMNYWLSYRNSGEVQNIKEEFKEVELIMLED
jgi:30S ribosomal protein 3